MSWEVIRKVVELASRGYGELGKTASKYTLSRPSIERMLSKKLGRECRFEGISRLRSYQIEPCVMDNKLKKQLTAVVEGGVTGFFGFWGVPFNIVLSIFLYFRAVQHIALFYGYDVVDDPRELELASDILVNCMSPTLDTAGTRAGTYVARLMFYGEISSLGRALAGRKTFAMMAREGGAQLMYTQVRALGHAAAKKGLAKAQRESLEGVLLKRVLQNIGRKLPKQMVGKAVPVLGALVGGGFDTYYMTRVVRMANLQYHKRFLIEKDERIGVAAEAAAI